MKITSVLSIVMAVAVSTSCAATSSGMSKKSAKDTFSRDIVLEGDSGPAPLALKYWIELTDDSPSCRDRDSCVSKKDITFEPEREFVTGDRFNVVLESNQKAFVYIFNESPKGQTTLIYPRKNHSLRVDARRRITIPDRGAFRFGGPTGQEKLILIASSKRLNQFDQVMDSGSPAPNPSSGQAAAQSDLSSEEMAVLAQLRGLTRDIVFEPGSSSSTASYVAQSNTPTSGQPLVQVVTLQHRAR